MKTFTVVHMMDLGIWRKDKFKADAFNETSDGTTYLYINVPSFKGDRRQRVASFPRGFCAGIWENECLIPSE